MSENNSISNKKEWEEEQKDQTKFNSVTQKSEPENQNQTHNARKEGISKINQNH